MLLPPGRTTPGPVISVVQSCSNSAPGLTALAHRWISSSTAYSAGFGSRCFPPAHRRYPLDIGHALAVGKLVAHGVASAFADRLAFLLAYSRHDVQHQPTSGRIRVERLCDRYQRHATPLEPLQQRAQILHASGEPIGLRNDDRLHFAGVNQREQPCHSGAVQALGGLAAIDDAVDQLGVVNHGHGANLLSLGLEGDTSVRLLVCRNANVANGFHR